MKLGATQYSLKDRAFDIFLAGCAAPHCHGCHNPSLWDFMAGDELDPYELAERMDLSIEMVDRIRIMGGEPFDQPLHELERLLDILHTYFPYKEIWIFTKYGDEELTKDQRKLLKYVDYIKHGRYEKDRPSYRDNFTGLILATDNQYVRRGNRRDYTERPASSNP